jgi:hypothetical protein
VSLTPISGTVADLELAMPRWASVLVHARQLAEVVANTDFVPKAMRGNPDAITAAIMYGDSLRLDPMMALQSIDVVEGRPRPSAQLARGLILAAGHSLVVHQMTGTACRLSGLRAGRPESERLTVEWTRDMAQAAGLTGRTNWVRYPRAMLAARATTDLANLLFPDVLKGLTWVSEADDSLAQADAWAGDVQAEEAAPTTTRAPQRRTRPKAPRSLPSPGYTVATPDRPGPDGSVDVPLVDPPVAPERPVRDVVDTPLPPEPPPPGQEPEAPPRPITPGQQKMLQTLLGLVLGTAAGDDERHQLQGHILGRKVTTSTSLSTGEASRLLDVLGQIERGTLALELIPGEGWVVRDAEGTVGPPPWDPPPEPTAEDPWTELGGGQS